MLCMNNHICCFTGTRDLSLFNINNLKKTIKIQVEKLIQQGFEYFITGNAIGVDTLCSKVVLELKKKYTKIQLEIALPFFKHNISNKKCLEIQKQADFVNIVSQTKSYIKAYKERDEYMVNKAELLIAVPKYSNQKIVNGGTKRTIDYAIKTHKKIIIIK